MTEKDLLDILDCNDDGRYAWKSMTDMAICLYNPEVYCKYRINGKHPFGYPETFCRKWKDKGVYNAPKPD